jgi:thiamine monophosphate synthase
MSRPGTTGRQPQQRVEEIELGRKNGMKYFAITPDSATPATLIVGLPGLKEKGASFLYLRAPALEGSLERILPAVNRAGILPLVPFRFRPQGNGSDFGVHFRSSETEFAEDCLFGSPRVTSASCHDFHGARRLLDSGVSYVFVSPVFEPLSKPAGTPHGELFPRHRLRELAGTYGERVVALGGMRPDRIRELAREVKSDFSVAGISLFFGGDRR